MKRAAAAVVLAGATLTGVSTLTAAPAAAHGACRSPEPRVTSLVASAKVRCLTARQVAIGYDTFVTEGGAFPGAGPVRAQGFRCRTAAVGHESEESFSVRCTSGGNVVRFAWGV